MNFAKAKQKTLTRSFEYTYSDAEGQEVRESVTVTFLEKCLTPAFLDTLTQFERKQDSSQIARHLSKVITAWDLTWNDEPFPPSFENLSEVCDFDFLMALVEVISESFQGKKQTPTGSPAGSAASAKAATEAPAD